MISSTLSRIFSSVIRQSDGGTVAVSMPRAELACDRTTKSKMNDGKYKKRLDGSFSGNINFGHDSS